MRRIGLSLVVQDMIKSIVCDMYDFDISHIKEDSFFTSNIVAKNINRNSQVSCKRPNNNPIQGRNY